MNTVSKLFQILCLCLMVTGCIVEAPESPQDDDTATRCSGDDCTNRAQRLGEECQLNEPGCGDGLECLEDLDAECEPSFCDAEVCTADCRVVYTCQRSRGPSIVVPRPGIDECTPGARNTCDRGEVCAPDFDQCISGPCDGPSCTAVCQIPNTCQPVSCDNTDCPSGTRCEEVEVHVLCAAESDCHGEGYVETVCMPTDGHDVGETCDETVCEEGFVCVEEQIFLECEGDGCEDPVETFVSCAPLDGDLLLPPQPEPAPRGSSCNPDADDCGEGFVCDIDQSAECAPSFCEGDVCTGDCQVIFICQPDPYFAEPEVGCDTEH